MNVEVKKVLDFLEADGRSFSIPPFQRPYSWDTWQCEVLWHDLEYAIDSDLPHFFGAVFYRTEHNDAGIKRVSLIDGQQRTLTLLLLLAALAEKASNDTEFSKTDLYSRIMEYLRSQEGSKVFPSQRDADSFTYALGTEKGKPKSISSDAFSNALVNKQFFLDKTDTSCLNGEKILGGLANFEIVAVELEDDDDAQSIFESFNSKGVPLVAADMVRNYLLLTEDPAQQEHLYLDYWEPIQGLFGDDPGSLRLNNALRAWTVIRCKTPKAKSDAECFGDFKRYFLDEYDGSNEDLMAELLSFCAVWAENYRYHAVKKYRSSNWAKIGRKTLVSGRPRVAARKEALDFYAKHYGVDFSEEE